MLKCRDSAKLNSVEFKPYELGCGNKRYKKNES